MINLSSKYIKPLRIHSRALKHHLLIWGYIFVLYILKTQTEGNIPPSPHHAP